MKSFIKNIGCVLLGILFFTSSGCSGAGQTVEITETEDQSFCYVSNHMEEQNNWLYHTDKILNNNVQAKELIEAANLFPDKNYTVSYTETTTVEDTRIKEYHFEERYKGIPVWETELVVTAYLDGTVVSGKLITEGFPEEEVFLSKDKLISDYMQEKHMKEKDCVYLGLYYFKKEKIYFCHALRVYPDSKTDAAYVMLNATAGNIEGYIPDMIS